MNPQDISKIGEITKHETEIKVKKGKEKIEKAFSEILDSEIIKKKEEVKKSSPTIPANKLLNIKETSSESLFISKAFKIYSDLVNSLDKYKNILEDENFTLQKAKLSIKDLKELVDKLHLILPEIQNSEIRNDIEKAILIGNVEIEKYLKGEYI